MDPASRRDFYGIAEVADALGLNRQLVTVWRRRRSHGMPEPDAELASGPLWRGETVEPWIDAMRRRLTSGAGAPVSAALARRATRRVLRLLALLLEDEPRQRLVARAAAEVRELLPLMDDGSGGRTDPVRRDLLRLLSPVDDAAIPAAENAVETGTAVEPAAYGALRAELLAALPTIPPLLAAVERDEAEPAPTAG